MIPNRRQALSLLGSMIAMPALAQSGGMSRASAYAFSFTGLDGRDILLADYAGKPILVVNTASLCGYIPQYEGLQQLWTRYRDRGLLSLAYPRTNSAARSRALRTPSPIPRTGSSASPSRSLPRWK